MASQDEEHASPSPGEVSSEVDSLDGVEHDPEEDFVVEEVLAEAVTKNNILGVPGEKRWLIRWTGYKLHDATWEPAANLSTPILEEWETKKKKIAAGEGEPFKIRQWKKAFLSYHHRRIEKQKMSNKTRRAQGRDLLEVDDMEFYRESAANLDSGDDSDDDLDWTAIDRDGEDSDMSTEFSSGSLPAESESGSSSDSNEARNNTSRDTGAALRHRAKHVQKTTTVALSAGSSADKARSSHSRTPSTNQKLGPNAKRTVPSKSSTFTNSAGPGGHRDIAPKPRESRDDNGVRSENPSNSRAATIQSPSAARPADSAAGRAASRLPIPPARKKQQLPPEAYRNVFSIGEPSKKRGSTLEKSASNPKLAPKFLNLRGQNILQKRARDGEGTRDPRISRKSNTSEGGASSQEAAQSIRDESPLFLPSEEPTDTSTEVLRAQATEEPTMPVATQTKRVSFAPETRQEGQVATANDQSQPMELDDEDVSFIIEGGETSSVPAAPSVVPPDLRTRCSLGPSSEIDITFVGMKGDVLTSHLSESEMPESLHFSHQCSVEDFRIGSSYLWKSTLASGPITTEGPAESLRALNAQLAMDSTALLCRIDNICVLLFSSSDRAWSEVLNISSQLDRDLPWYIVFDAAPEFASRLLEPYRSQKRVNDRKVPPSGVLGLEKMLQLRQYLLLPFNARGKVQVSFFLLFPESTRQECSLLAKWLHLCHADIRILSSLVTTNWSSFKNLPTGVVIIHESALESMRILPGLGDLLWSPDSARNYSFWVFGANHQRRMDMRRGSFDDVAEQETAPILRPLLPDGTAFLITPSFLISQPRYANEFIKWFSKRFVEQKPSPRPLCKLVMHKDLPFAKGRSLFGNAASESTFHVKIQHNIEKLLGRDDADDPESFANHMVLVPQHLDANDEQSIVNWFACWATGHLERFRRFEVLGTGHSDSPRLTQRVCVPRYLAESVRDSGFPDDATQSATTSSLRVREVAIAKSSTNPDRTAVNNALSVIETELMSMATFFKSTMPLAVVYNKPVGYFSRDMPFRYGDSYSRLATFERWFDFFFSFEEIQRRKCQNTLFGFFYTIDSAWEPEAHDADLPQPRHPWFAIFRPKNLHRRPWKFAELLIWDATFASKFSKNEMVFESDLIPAQQALIRQVNELNRYKNPNEPLDMVWVSGEGLDHTLTSRPVEATFKRLDDLIRNIKSDLNANADKLPDCGWSPLQRGKRPPEQPLQSIQPRAEAPSNFTVGESDTEGGGDDRKIVFHPPRGPSELYKKKIENRLLLAAQRAKDEGRGFEVDFEFVPTVQWYEDLKQTKRHSEHIRVVQWSTILQELGIPTRDY
ncbi:chromo (CHRromatin organization MOdifier) domain-containing protein [Sarocladium implicatum]|nr:chromo (CHRromatin organization MOdifier) domain-containing protein [Sarocladium implicatum]